MRFQTSLGRGIVYGALILAGVILSSLALDVGYKRYKAVEEVPASSGIPPQKVGYYLDHADEYDALFFGDSRTLCGMHPSEIDPLWGRKSYNIAHWALWLVTQYTILSDIIDHIPEGTVFVWSVGHQNFRRQEIQAIYPVGWQRIPYLLRQGYPLEQLVGAQLSFVPWAALLGRRMQLYNKIEEGLARPALSFGLPEAQEVGHKTEIRGPSLEKYKEGKNIGYIRPWYDEEALVSVAQYKKDGALLRTELRPEFYRHKQKESPSNRVFEGYKIDEGAWALFEEMLRMLRDKNINVIINEVDEAPYTYASRAEQKKFLKFLREHAKPLVESYGFSYVHVNYDRMKNADYFDYNHLNAKGVKKFSAMLAPRLKKAARNMK